MDGIAAAGAVLVALTSGYLLFTLVLSRRRAPRFEGAPPVQTIVIVVPCLNEARVIAGTLDSLTRLDDPSYLVLVVDDGSDDGTAAVVAPYLRDNVRLVRRDLPNARQGKGAVLNAAYRHILQLVHEQGASVHRTVVGIVDADGRLPADALSHVRPYFEDPYTGAVQLQVRIRNRDTMLGRFQDYEFLLFSSVTQTAREHLGTVGLGGNGQFARLSALRSLGEEPWSDCLTEDLDLGVRLATTGWINRFCRTTHVDQQGVGTVRAIIRQRTRWMHGHFQCWKLIPSIFTSKLPTVTALDLIYYLMAPSLAVIGSIVFPIPVALLIWNVATNAPAFLGSVDGVGYLTLLYAMSFGPMCLLGLMYRRRAGDITRRRALLMAHLLMLYSWVWYIAEWRAIWRIVRRRTGWAKTGRLHEAPARP